MEEVWRATDRSGRQVVLNADGWRHILDRHPEFTGRENELRAAVERPDRVTRDAFIAVRECLYRRTTGPRPWLKVVVHYRPVPPQGTWAGSVITAYPAPEVKRKERQLWP